MTKKSRLGIIVAAAAIALMATGCSSSPATNSDPNDLAGTLEIQTGLAPDSSLMAALTDTAKAFQAEHPDVHLTLVPGSATYEQDMKVRMASGKLPDMWWTHGWSLLRYSDFLMPLQDEPWAKNLNPALDSAMLGKGGELYAMPIDTNFAGLLYNKDVLDKAGVKPEEIKNWDEFKSAAEAVKATGVPPIFASGKAAGPAGALVTWPAAGGFFTHADNDKMKKGTFVSGKYEDILKMVEDWRDAGFINPDYVTATADDQAKALAQGNAGFEFRPNAVGTDALKYNPEAKIGFMPVPSDTGSPYLIGGEYNAFGISKATKYPATAKAFLAFMAQPENESKLAQSVGSAPGLTDAKSDLGGLQDSYDTWVTKEKVPLQPYWDRVNTPNGYWNTIVTTADSVITKQGSINDALTKLQSDFSRLSAQSK